MDDSDFMNHQIFDQLGPEIDLNFDLDAFFAKISEPVVSENGNGRFVPHQNLNQFLEEQRNLNTKRKTANDLKLFTTYLQMQNEMRFPEFIPPSELSDYISGFLLAVRRKDGSEYEPTTLRSFLSSINRHLISKDYKFSVITDVQFRKCRDVLSAKQKTTEIHWKRKQALCSRSHLR